jgi:hypothetical protein
VFRCEGCKTLLSNAAAAFALTALVLTLPLRLEAMLVGLGATMIC